MKLKVFVSWSFVGKALISRFSSVTDQNDRSTLCRIWVPVYITDYLSITLVINNFVNIVDDDKGFEISYS